MIKPLNGNVLVEPIKNQAENVFSESDSRKDLQYGVVIETCTGYLDESIIKTIPENVLRKGDTIIYNPRSITSLVHEGKLYGMLHEKTIQAIL